MSIDQSNLCNAIYDGRWDDITSYLDEIEAVDDHGDTALHFAYFYHARTPIAVLRTLVDAYPVACKKQNSLGFTPLHYSGLNASDEATLILIQKAPEAVCMVNFTTGCTPLHYAVRDCRSYDIIKKMIDANPDSLYVADFSGQTPLDLFFRKWYASFDLILQRIAIVTEESDNADCSLRRAITPKRILDMGISFSCRCEKATTVGYVYQILSLLVHSMTKKNEKDFFSLVLQLPNSPWTLCQLFLHIHPEQIMESRSFLSCCIGNKSDIYNIIYKCARCKVATESLYIKRNIYYCQSCFERNQRINAQSQIFSRNEDLEQVQFIYKLFRANPSICCLR